MINSMSIPARIKYVVFTLIFTVAAVNFVRTTLDILRSSKRLEDLRTEVTTMEGKKADLNDSLEYKKTQEYIEERARNALNLVKPGEKVYVSSQVLGEATENLQSAGFVKEKSNFELWVDLFF